MYSLYYLPIARKLGLAKTTEWGVAIRKITNGYDTILGKSRRVEFCIINNTDDYWFADPILFSDNGKTWLFVEAFNKKAGKGEIGYFEIIDGKAVNFKLVIETPTHMSYPFVFKHNEDYYMIPETGAARHIALYKANKFPEEWVLDKILLEGDVYRDSTIISEGDGQFKVYSYKQEGTNRFNMRNTFTIFHLNMNDKTLSVLSSFEDKDKAHRPAGPCFSRNGKIIRVAQKCNRAYGEAMFVYEQTSIIPSNDDAKINLFDGNDIKLEGGKKVVLTHTYSQAGGYEVVDYRCLI